MGRSARLTAESNFTGSLQGQGYTVLCKCEPFRGQGWPRACRLAEYLCVNTTGPSSGMEEPGRLPAATGCHPSRGDHHLGSSLEVSSLWPACLWCVRGDFSSDTVHPSDTSSPGSAWACRSPSHHSCSAPSGAPSRDPRASDGSCTAAVRQPGVVRAG